MSNINEKLINYNDFAHYDKKIKNYIDTMNAVDIHDTALGYTKNVPAETIAIARVNKIGGMTRKCTNLIPYPYLGTTKTENGITFTDNGDGSISVSGTATAIAFFDLCVNADLGMAIDAISKDYATNGSYAVNRGLYYNPNNKKVSLAIDGGKTVDTTYYPMLNEGSTALPYEPYFEGLRSAKVTEVESVGVNLFDINALHTVVPGGTYKYNLYGKPNTRYTFSTNVPEGNPANIYANGDSTVEHGIHEGRSITTTTDEYGKMYCEVRYNNTGTGIDVYTELLNGTYYLMINEGDNALPYAPYVKHTLSIPEAVQALDGYGWGVNDEVYNYIDYDNKQFVKCVGVVDMGTLNWTYLGDRFKSQQFDIKRPGTLAGRRTGFLCEKYSASTNFDATALDDKSMIRHDEGVLFVKDTTYTDAASFKAAMSGVMLYYELAEPEVIDISDILPADNIIGAEGGGIITMVNEYKYAVPSSITYTIDKSHSDIWNEFEQVYDSIALPTLGITASADELNYTSGVKSNIQEQLDRKVEGITTIVNDSVAYSKDIPEFTSTYAHVNKVGGMTRKSANLIPYPYVEDTKTRNGVTFTVNGDGTVTASGTAVDYNATLNLANNISFPAGTYRVTCTDTPKDGVVLAVMKNGVWHSETTNTMELLVESGDVFTIYLQVVPGVSVPNFTFKPMLNEGSTALPYEPYFEGLRSAPVTEVESVGANLFDYESHRKNGNTSVIKVIPNKTLYRNAQLGNSSMWEIYDNADALIGTFSSFNFTTSNPMVLPSNAAYIQSRDNIYTLANFYLGYDSDTIYRPYVKHTLPIPAEVQALEGYGDGVNDSVYNYIDYEKKQFVKRVGVVDLGTLDWRYSTSASAFFVEIKDGKYGSNNALMPKYSKVNGEAIFTTDKAFTFGSNFIGGGACSFVIHDTAYTDTASFKAAMSGVMLYYELAEPIVTDISDILSNDNLIGVEGGGTITMVNEHEFAVPSEILIHTDNVDIFGADLFIGDLDGVASKAICDKNGNDIVDTYAKISDLSDLGAGDMLKATYDTDNDGIVDKAETATNAEKLGGAAASEYAKTSSLGSLATKSTVSKTDLDSTVQASLNKADSALQSYTESDPTVPSHVKSITTSDITNWNNKSTFDGDYNSLTNTPSSLKNPTALTFGSKSYDGSTAKEITAADLGLSGAMKFLGTSTTAISDGSTTKTITVNGSSVTVTAGNVVLYDGKEFVWDGSKWEELGHEGSFKVKQAAVASPSASGSTTAFIDTISQDANGNISATKKNISEASTSAKGIVQLTDSTSSTSTTTAATPNSVKSAYDLANTAKTNAATAQSKADSAYTLAESKVDSLSDLGITATATELNYTDGVTSNIQTQLDNKVSTSRTINNKALSANITLTKEDLGLGSVDNTADADKSVASAKSLEADPQITSAEAMDNFLTGNKLKYASFKLDEDTQNLGFGSNDGMLLSIPWSNNTYGAQIAFDDRDDAKIAVRGKSNTWGSWYKLIHTGNISSQSVNYATSAGSATTASSCTGNAATATQATQDGNGNNIAETYAKKSSLATVATSGSYNDLSNKPTIPAAYSHPSTHPASMITGLATVATTGNYHDLSNKPTSLPASDVYSWAKAASKPSYTADDVGALAIDGGNALGDIAFYLEDDCYFTYNGSEVATHSWVTNTYATKASLNNYLPLSGGTMTNSIITPKNDNMGIIPHTDNFGQIGSSDKKFYRMYASTFYGNISGGYYDGEDSYSLIHSGNISSQTVAKAGTCTGNAATATSATKATQDGNGNNIADTYAKKSSLATVATSGSYNDLSSRPSIPDSLSDLSSDSTHRTVTDDEKTAWNAKSTFSGSYDDLTNKPSIPAAANNGTLTIQKNGTYVATFTANSATNATANITVPTTTSELTNNSGFITSSSIPTALKNPSALKFGSQTYDGSSEKTITASDLGLGNVNNTADANKSVKYATSAGSATSATNATNADKLGGVAASEYAKKSDIGASMTYLYGTEDLVAGESPLETGKLYFMYV